MIAARFRRPVPNDAWVAEVSRAYPDATLRLLAGIQRGDTAVELGESYSADPEGLVAATESHPDILSLERLEMTDRRSFTTYETTDTGLYAFFRGASIPPEFPITVTDGWFEFDFTGTREDFERLRTVLEGADRPFELVSLVEDLETGQPLTTRQREVLEVALRNGYFAVPRNCTLADVAASLDIDRSTASRIIRRGQARLMERQLVVSGGARR